MDDTVIIEVTPEVLGQKSLVDNLTSISPAIQIFLTSIIEIGKQPGKEINSNRIVTRNQVQALLKKLGKGSSNTVVSRRLKELLDHNVASVTKHPQPYGKRLNHYLLTDLSPLVRLPSVQKKAEPRQRRTKAQFRSQVEMFNKDGNAILLQDYKNLSIHFHEQVFNGILDSAMRLSHKDPRKEIRVECQIAGKPLRITANCSSAKDSDVATLTDQRAMRAIISYCKKNIAKHKAKMISEFGKVEFSQREVPDIFHMDIHDLCKLMGMACSSKNLDVIVGMMRRLADTNFRVDASENAWFRKNFSVLPGDHLDIPESDIFEFRFLQNFEIANEDITISDLFGSEFTELRPRFYTFNLERRLFCALLYESSTNLFLSHEELASERSGIIQRFYNWARAFLSGREKYNLSQRWYSAHDMHEYLTPAARFDNFRSYFMRALQKFAINGDWKKGHSGVSLIYGYYIYYERQDGEDMFRFERDPTDQIVGDNSRHNVLLRQQALLDVTEDTDEFSVVETLNVN